MSFSTPCKFVWRLHEELDKRNWSESSSIVLSGLSSLVGGRELQVWSAVLLWLGMMSSKLFARQTVNQNCDACCCFCPSNPLSSTLLPCLLVYHIFLAFFSQWPHLYSLLLGLSTSPVSLFSHWLSWCHVLYLNALLFLFQLKGFHYHLRFDAQICLFLYLYLSTCIRSNRYLLSFSKLT